MANTITSPTALFKLQFVTIDTSSNQQTIVDVLVLDASLNEMHEADADVSEFPIEQGADITDNVRVKPQTLQVEALITDTHLSSQQAAVNAERARGQTMLDKDSRDTLAALEAFQADGTLINVETGLKSYENMVIKSLRTSRNKDLKNAIKVTINLVEVLIVNSQTVVVKQAVPKAQPVIPKGTKTPTTATTGQEDQSNAYKSIMGNDTVNNLKKSLSDSVAAGVKALGFGP